MKKSWYIGVITATLSTSSFALDPRTISVDRQATEAYFTINVRDGGLLQGTFAGWCADWATRIEDGVSYNTKFYSSYAEDLPAGLVAKPENLDEMNWLINQSFVGAPSPSGLGFYTTGDVQLAIWSLLDDSFDSTTVGEFSQARVDELTNLSLSHGDQFYPTCDQVVGMLFAPSAPETGESVQSIITEVPRDHFPKCVIPDGDLQSP